MREVVIALGLIEQGDNYLLQHRKGNPRIGATGLIGCYGGKIEEGETPQQAICREMAEETTLQPDLDDFEDIGYLEVTSDYRLEPVKIKAHLFRIAVEVNVQVESREGALVSLKQQEARASLDKMTPGTRAAFEKYILGD